MELLLGELSRLEHAFRAKGRELTGLLKVGRTQLQDAVPMTVRQELEGFATTLAEEHPRYAVAMSALCSIKLVPSSWVLSARSAAASSVLSRWCQCLTRVASHAIGRYATTMSSTMNHFGAGIMKLAAMPPARKSAPTANAKTVR